jgi:predicted transposase YbfD/YdcC
MSRLALTEMLADIADPRSCQGRIHALPAVLALVVLGLLMGCTSLSGIARLGRLYCAPLAQALGFRRGKTPSKVTLSELLRILDVNALEAALTHWIGSRPPAEPEHISLDGKTLKGSRDGLLPGQHLVAAYAPQVQLVLAQMRVDAKTNEHKGKTAVEVVYGITSLSPARANAQRLLALVRDHWRIENSLHYVRDVTLGEDRRGTLKGYPGSQNSRKC